MLWVILSDSCKFFLDGANQAWPLTENLKQKFNFKDKVIASSMFCISEARHMAYWCIFAFFSVSLACKLACNATRVVVSRDKQCQPYASVIASVTLYLACVAGGIRDRVRVLCLWRMAERGNRGREYRASYTGYALLRIGFDTQSHLISEVNRK